MVKPVTVDVSNGRLVVTEQQHVDLLGHIYRRDSDRALLTELWTRVNVTQTGGA